MAESENTETEFDDKVSDSEIDLDVSTVSTHSTDLQDPETESASILLPENYALLEQQPGSISTISTVSTDITDIAQGILELPVQPITKFPTTLFGSKRRSFNRAWYQKYPWLEYSVKNNTAFCYACRYFAIAW